jgi:1-acyl-sn-glycerol-3-phosphate acyltransferase
MRNILKSPLAVGVILYLFPIGLTFLVFRFFSWCIDPIRSIENAAYAYAAFVVLIAISIIGGYNLAKSKKKRSWIVRFFFATIATILSLPVLVLALIGLSIVWVQNKLARSKWVSEKRKERIKSSQFGCFITSVLAGMLAFSNFLFIIEKGNIRVFRNLGKAVVVFNHLSSGDYFLAAIIALFRNWRVMIGANLWGIKFFHFFFNIVGVPIEREDGAHRKRVEAMNISKAFLDLNKKALLGVFSQGTREREPEKGITRFSIGAFVIACELEIPIIPAVIKHTERWRAPWVQDKTSQKGRKSNPFKFIVKFAKQYYSTGITPTIATVRYGNPISTVGKTPKEVMEETRFVMNQMYSKRVRRGRRKRNKIFKEA